MTRNIDHLLAKYFGGCASGNDMLDLEHWIAQSPENQQYFDQFTRLYGQLGTLAVPPPQPNRKEAKAKFLAYMNANQVTDSSNVLPLTRKPWYRQWTYRVAGIAAALILAVTLHYTITAEKEILLASSSNPRTEILPDGTEVRLSRYSSIRYRSDFGKGQRLLRLEGEARIKVGHLGKGKFQLWTDKIRIEDIGTTFVVSAYPDSSDILVRVTEGLVRMSLADSKTIRLQANESCRYHKSTGTFRQFQAPTSAQPSLPDLAPAPDKHLYFNAVPLRTVIHQVSEAYQVSIRLQDAEIGSRTLTVNFDEENLDRVLQVIAETLNLEVKKEAGGYLIGK